MVANSRACCGEKLLSRSAFFFSWQIRFDLLSAGKVFSSLLPASLVPRSFLPSFFLPCQKLLVRTLILQESLCKGRKKERASTRVHHHVGAQNGEREGGEGALLGWAGKGEEEEREREKERRRHKAPCKDWRGRGREGGLSLSLSPSLPSFPCKRRPFLRQEKIRVFFLYVSEEGEKERDLLSSPLAYGKALSLLTVLEEEEKEDLLLNRAAEISGRKGKRKKRQISADLRRKVFFFLLV